MGKTMNISVIIPTFNAAGQLPALLDSLKMQKSAPGQIIVLDSGSTDGTEAIAKNYGATVVPIDPGRFDHGRTRNIGAKKASGDVLVYLTQDVRLADADALGNLVEPLAKDDSIGACYGRQLPTKDADIFEAFLRHFNYPAAGYVFSMADSAEHGLRTIFFSNSFGAYRGGALAQVGYFAQPMAFGEDSHCVAKLLKKGYRVAYEPSARAIHSHSYSLRAEFWRYFHVGQFHGCHRRTLGEFGSAGTRARQYLQGQLRYLLERKKAYLVPQMLLRAAAKWAGYKAGLCKARSAAQS